jgi:DNA-binding transcriptional LysR family regulator
MDLNAVRTFVVATDEGQFQAAAVELGISQQAVSKRVAALETALGVSLFTRTARGIRLTADGEAFLPPARALLEAADRAVESVRPGRRALRVDVLARRLAAASIMREFHREHPEIELDIVTLPDVDAATAAVLAGTVDSSFCTPRTELPAGLRSMRAHDEPLDFLVGPRHKLADAGQVTVKDLVGHRIWMPGLVPGSEGAAYHEELAEAFGLTIDVAGPNFGTDHLLDMIADTPSLGTLMGAGVRLVWTEAHDLRRIPVRGPTPVYPTWLVWRADNRHPGLADLRRHLDRRRRSRRLGDVWTASWAA